MKKTKIEMLNFLSILKKNRDEIFTPYEQAFYDLCECKDIYEAYIKNYYGNNEWVAFQRNFIDEQSTSIIDITAFIINKKIIVYDINDKIIYNTANNDKDEILIQYKNNHFTRYSPLLSDNDSYSDESSDELMDRSKFFIKLEKDIKNFFEIFSSKFFSHDFDLDDPLVSYLLSQNIDVDQRAQAACFVSTIKTVWPELSDNLTFRPGASRNEIEQGISSSLERIDFQSIKKQIHNMLSKVNPIMNEFFDSFVEIFFPDRSQTNFSMQENIRKSDPVIKKTAQFLLSEKNKEYQKSFSNFKEVLTYEGRERLEKFLKNALQNPNVRIKILQEQLIGFSLMQELSEAILDDSSKAIETSSSLSLTILSMMIDDFISPHQTALWMFNGAHNFGYQYSSERIIEERFIKEKFAPMVADITVNHLDSIVDNILDLSIRTLVPGSYIKYLTDEENQQKILILYELWKIQFDKRVDHDDMQSFFGLNKIKMKSSHKPLIGFDLTLVWYGEYWLIEEYLRNCGDEKKIDEIKRKLSLIKNIDGLPFNILKFIYGHDDHHINNNFSRLMMNIENFLLKIKNSRTIENDKEFQALFGMGFSGEIFNHRRDGLTGKVFFTFSSKCSDHYHRLLLKLLKDRLDQIFLSEKMDNVEFILAEYKESNARMHNYIALYILKKVYQNPRVVHREILDSWRRVLKANCLSNINSKNNKIKKLENKIIDIEKKKKKSSADDHDLLRAEDEFISLNKEVILLSEIVNVSDDLTRVISDEALELLRQQFIVEKRSLCIESMISAQSYTNYYMPIVFRRDHPTSLKKNGELITIGNHERRVISPCDELCQLFAPAHLLWATLINPELNLQTLHDHAIEHGKTGVRSIHEHVSKNQSFFSRNGSNQRLKKPENASVMLVSSTHFSRNLSKMKRSHSISELARLPLLKDNLESIQKTQLLGRSASF